MDNEFVTMMINEQKASHNRLMEVLYFLKYTPGFYLTGSRFFDTARVDSDYDFFIKLSDLRFGQAYRDLERFGFEREWDGSYSDDPTVAMVFWYHGSIDIHIQIIKDTWFDDKVAAQEKIKEFFQALPDVMSRLGKLQMKSLWRRLLKI